MGHIPTQKQEQAFNNVVKAFQEAKKAGLVFYGKSGSLVAYKKSADNYIDEEDFHKSTCNPFGTVPHLSSHKCIVDSGADDYGKYRTEEDEYKFDK